MKKRLQLTFKKNPIKSQASIIICFILFSSYISYLGSSSLIKMTKYLGSNFFQVAFDEAFYYSFSLKKILRTDRLLSNTTLRTLSHFGSFANIHLYLNIIVSFILGLLATSIGWRITNSLLKSILFATMILFAGEFLSTQCSLIYSQPWFTNIMPQHLKFLAPDATVSFFSIFRSPEPQLSYILFFLIIFLELALIHKKTNLRKIIFILVCLSLPYGYSFVTIPLAVFVFLRNIFSYFYDNRNVFYFRCVLSCALAVSYGLSLILSNPFKTSGSLIFYSRLPYATPAVFFSILGTLVILIRTQKKRYFRDMDSFSLSCFLIPLILMNQQIVTGILVSTRDWERYSNYQWIVLGCSTLIVSYNFKIFSKLLSSLAVLALSCFFLMKVYSGQKSNFTGWYEYNRKANTALDFIRSKSLYGYDSYMIDDVGTSLLLEHDQRLFDKIC